MKDDMLKKIEDFYDLDKHQEIIDLIEALPADQLNNELLDGGISWVVSVNGEIIGTIEQDAALYSVFLSSQDFDKTSC